MKRHEALIPFSHHHNEIKTIEFKADGAYLISLKEKTLNEIDQNIYRIE